MENGFLYEKKNTRLNFQKHAQLTQCEDHVTKWLIAHGQMHLCAVSTFEFIVQALMEGGCMSVEVV